MMRIILCTRFLERACRLVVRFDGFGRFSDATERFVDTGGSEACWKFPGYAGSDAERAKERSEGAGDFGRNMVGGSVCARAVEDC